MSSVLIEKLRRARETKVQADGKNYTIRRPTDYEAINSRGFSDYELACKFVVGWDLVELDVVPGGGPEPVAFTPALFAEWVADKPRLWEVFAKEIVDGYKRHAAAAEGAGKNS